MEEKILPPDWKRGPLILFLGGLTFSFKVAFLFCKRQGVGIESQTELQQDLRFIKETKLDFLIFQDDLPELLALLLSQLSSSPPYPHLAF